MMVLALILAILTSFRVVTIAEILAISFLTESVFEDVRAGDVVALVGETGSLKGPCLYFEIRQRGKPLDPLEWLAN